MFKKNGKVYMWVKINGTFKAMKVVKGLNFNTITQKLEAQARIM